MLTRMQGLMGRLAKDGYKRASRLEKKADLLIKGYQVRVAQCRLGVWWLHAVAATQVRSQGVLGRIHSLAEQVEQVETQLKCFTVVILGAGVCVCRCSDGIDDRRCGRTSWRPSLRGSMR